MESILLTGQNCGQRFGPELDALGVQAFFDEHLVTDVQVLVFLAAVRCPLGGHLVRAFARVADRKRKRKGEGVRIS